MGQEGKNHHPPTCARHNARCFLCFAASRVTTLLSTGTRHVSACACPASLKSSSVFMGVAVSYVAAALILWKLLFNEPWQARLNFKLALQPREVLQVACTKQFGVKSQGQTQQLLRRCFSSHTSQAASQNLQVKITSAKTVVFNA